MAKLSGFFMSTLLIVLCLWINVCHYPDAANAAKSNGAPATPSVSPASPASSVSPSVEDAPNEEEPAPPSGLLADADVGAVPALLDVSASRPIASPTVDPAAVPPVLEPASFPVDGAEIDDAPTPSAPSADAAPSNAAPSNVSAPSNASPADAAPLNSSISTSQTASPAVASPTQDARRLATKPRGAKYVRVPEVEIDAFFGGVRSGRSSDEESRVVGATRAGQTTAVAPTVSSAP